MIYIYAIPQCPPVIKKRLQSLDIVQVAPWTDAGAIDESHVTAGKSQRKSVSTKS